MLKHSRTLIHTQTITDKCTHPKEYTHMYRSRRQMGCPDASVTAEFRVGGHKQISGCPSGAWNVVLWYVPNTLEVCMGLIVRK